MKVGQIAEISDLLMGDNALNEETNWFLRAQLAEMVFHLNQYQEGHRHCNVWIVDLGPPSFQPTQGDVSCPK